MRVIFCSFGCMTVQDLRKMIKGLPGDMPVYIPGSPKEGFTGEWISPCNEDSGGADLGFEDLTDEEIEERKLLNDPPKVEKALCLVPCGFFEPHDHSHELN
jgi:hypothetical protein